MKENKIKSIINIITAVIFAILFYSGFILWKIIPICSCQAVSGTVNKLLSFNFLGLVKNNWVAIYTVFSLAFFILIIARLFLHSDLGRRLLKLTKREERMDQYIINVVICSLLVVFFYSAFVLWKMIPICSQNSGILNGLLSFNFLEFNRDTWMNLHKGFGLAIFIAIIIRAAIYFRIKKSAGGKI